MLWHLADALHFNSAQAWVIPLVNAVFDIAFHYVRSTKSLEVQLVVFPHRRRMLRAHAKRPWADVPGLNIKGRFCRCMIMDNPSGGYDHTITTLFNAFNMVGQFGVNALP